MLIDTKQIITATEANQNFSKATRLADEYGFKPAWYSLGLLGNNAWNN